jgi:hypothetical protein
MILSKIAQIFNKISGFLAVFALIVLFVFFGFDTNNLLSQEFVYLCRVLSSIGALSICIRYVSSLKWNLWIITYDVLFLTYF